MGTTRFHLTVQSGGRLELPTVEFEPGTEVEVVIYDSAEGERLSEITGVLATEAFARFWDNPEEDAAWAYLQRGK